MPSLLRACPALFSVLACGGPPAPSGSMAPTPKPEPVTAEALATPTEPAPGLAITETGTDRLAACGGHDLSLRVGDRETVIEGSCHGACTPEEKAAGQAAIDEIRARIDAGEASESELDYNFTECLFHGTRLGRHVQAAGRELALLEGTAPGPHDTSIVHYQLATEVCGEPFLGTEFGATYTNRWTLDDLHVTAEDDSTVVVTVDDGGTAPRELYRVTFTGCSPEESADGRSLAAAPHLR